MCTYSASDYRLFSDAYCRYSGWFAMSHWKNGSMAGAAPEGVPAGACSRTTAYAYFGFDAGQKPTDHEFMDSLRFPSWAVPVLAASSMPAMLKNFTVASLRFEV